jgi:hypothetical protein
LRCVWEGGGGGVRPDSATDIWGVSVEIKRETLIAVCQLAGISAAALILPCSLIDLQFDTDFLGMLMQAMRAGVALALIVAVWVHQEE